MWQPDIKPQFGFEEAAQVMGIRRARELWDGYRVMEQRKAQEADALEMALARRTERRGGYVVNEELGGAPEWRMAPWTFVRIWRASMNEKGCTGGEFLDDSHYMRWFLNRNRHLSITALSGKIMSGWSRATERGAWGKSEGGSGNAEGGRLRDSAVDDRLERASKQGEVERAFELQQRAGVVMEAA